MKGYRFINPDWEPVRRVLICVGWIVGAVLMIVLVRFAVNYFATANERKIAEIAKEGKASDEAGNSSNNSDSGDSDVSNKNSNDINIEEPSGLPHYAVTHVRDGDTVEIISDGNELPVRLIGVDTPESVHPTKPTECYGSEASNYTKSRLLNKEIGIELDASQGEYDSTDEGRLLAYVYIDGKNYNLELIKEGYALEYTYDTPYKYQSEFKLAQTEAINSNKGLWGACRTPEPSNVIHF